MSARPLRIPRDLSAIATDLATTRQRIAVLNVEPDTDDGWDALVDRRDALQCEFKAVFFILTGMRWSVAEGVMS